MNLKLATLYVLLCAAILLFPSLSPTQVVQVVIPDTSALSGQTISIPINVDDVTGLNIYSYQSIIAYNSTVLNATNVYNTGSISAPWGPPTFNLATPGIISLGGFGTAPLAGVGTLVFLEFTVNGNPGDTTHIHFQNFLFNAGTPTSNTTDGIFTVTQPPVDITIASDPAGLQIEVDGTPVTTPQTYNWNPGDNHTLNAPSPQSGGTGIRYVYNAWSNGGSQSQTISVPGSPTTYTASYDTEYELTTAVDPAASGTITLTPNQNWFISGATVSLEALPNAGYTFDHWSGDLTGNTNPESLIMDGPKDVTAHFIIPQVQITIESDPTGRQIEVDGTPITTPQTYNWNPGDSHTLNAPSPQSGGTGIRYVYNAWSNGGSQSQTITVPGIDSTFSASYNTEYELTTGVDPPGSGTITVTPNQSWFLSGTSITLEAVPGTGHTFDHWSGDLTGNANPESLLMDGPKDVTAHFIVPQVQITIESDPTGREIEVDGTPVTTPQTYSWNPGDSHTLNAPSPQSGGTGIQYVYNSWSNGGTQSQTLTVPGNDSTFTAFYDTEYELTTSVDPTGGGTINITPNQTWFMAGSEVELEAVPTVSWIFLNWSGDLTGSQNPDTLIMDAPKNVIAVFEFVDKLPADLATQVPEEFVLYQNYPNPFNPETQIFYGLPRMANVSLEVYDISGRKVLTLFTGKQQAGFHNYTWFAQHLGSGVYILQMQAGNFTSCKKVVLMK